MKNNMEKNFSKQNRNVMILTGLLAVLVMATVLFPIRKLDQITGLGNEMQYWGGAMTLLGQDWSPYMEYGIPISYGYSILLVPLCILFKNASLAYKAAILLNGCFMAAAYLSAVKTGRKMFQKASPYFSPVAGFLVMLLPLYQQGRLLIGPEAILLFLFWESISLLYDLGEHYTDQKMIGLSVLMILSVWLEPAMLVVIFGMVCYIHYMVKKDKEQEKRNLIIIFGIAAGLIVGIFAEQSINYYISSEGGKMVTSGIQAFVGMLASGAATHSIMEMLFLFFGKLFALVVNSWGILLIALWKYIRQKKERFKEITLIKFCMNLLLFSVLIFSVSQISHYEELYFDLGFLPVLAGPVLLYGLYEISTEKESGKQALGSILILVGCMSIVDYPVKKLTEIDYKSFLNIFSVMSSMKHPVSGVVYFIPVVAGFCFLLICALLRFDENRGEKVILKKGRRAAGIAVLMIASVLVNMGIFRVVEKKQAEYKPYHEIADLAKAVDEPVYYPEKSRHMAVLQMLMGEKDLTPIEGNTAVKREKHGLFITMRDNDYRQKEIPGGELVFANDKFLIWAKQGTESAEKMDEVLLTKEKKARNTKKNTYGKKILLSKGSYMAEFEFDVTECVPDEMIGKLIIKSSDGILQTKQIRYKGEKGETAYVEEIPFSDDKVMEDVVFKAELSGTTGAVLRKVIYRKTDHDYMIGLSKEDDLKEIRDAMKQNDRDAGIKSGVQYVDSDHGKNEDGYSSDHLRKLLKGYRVRVTGKAETDPEYSYLIFETPEREYYDLLDTHSILMSNSGYTLLAETGSIQAEQMKKEQGMLLSEGKRLDLKVFSERSEDGTYDTGKPVSLHEGSYDYIVEIERKKEKKPVTDMTGRIILKDGKKELTDYDLSGEQLSDGKTVEIAIPIYSGHKIRALHAEIETDMNLLIRPVAVEVKEWHYRLGEEEKDMKKIADLVNKSVPDAVISYLLMRDVREDETSFAYLKKLMPEARFREQTYHEAMNYEGDQFLLTDSHSTAFFRMVSEYTMIGHAGNYILWVKTDGKNMEQVLKAGGSLYSQGNKISYEYLSGCGKKKKDKTLHTFYPGTYQVYLNLNIQNKKKNDIIEVRLARDKTEKELAKDRKNLKELGYPKDEIPELTDETLYYDLQEFEENEFQDNMLMIRIEAEFPGEVSDLRAVCSSWKGSKVSARIAWVELAE